MEKNNTMEDENKIINLSDHIEQKEEFKPEIVNVVYDPETGTRVPSPEGIVTPDEDAVDKLIHADGDDPQVDYNTTDVKNYILQQYGQFPDQDEFVENIIKYHNKEDLGNLFDLLPKTFQMSLLTRMRDMQIPVSKLESYKQKFAKNFFDSTCADYELEHLNLDFEAAMAQLEQSRKEMSNRIGKEFGAAYVSSLNSYKTSMIDLAKKSRDAGEEEKAEDYERIASAFDEVYNLNHLEEFAKTVKIKKYEIENPDRVFTTFNSKYYNNKIQINDIRACPKILYHHFKHWSKKLALAVCEVFCKECLNYNPTDAYYHTYMYYFIRNIIAMDVIAPQGDTSRADDEGLIFYKHMHDRIDTIAHIVNDHVFDGKGIEKTVIDEVKEKKLTPADFSLENVDNMVATVMNGTSVDDEESTDDTAVVEEKEAPVVEEKKEAPKSYYNPNNDPILRYYKSKNRKHIK